MSAFIRRRNEQLNKQFPKTNTKGKSLQPAALTLDRWMTRVTQAAQISGVVIALITLFHTVIPLYQKAALDEQVAQKSIELKKLQLELSETKSQIRAVELQKYARNVIDDCTGLSILLEPPEVIRSKQSLHERLIQLDVGACIRKHAQSSERQSQFNAEDSARIGKNLESIAIVVDTDHEQTLAMYKSLPARATENPAILVHVDNITTEWNGILFKGNKISKAELAMRQFNEDVSVARNKLVSDFVSRSRAAINSIDKL